MQWWLKQESTSDEVGGGSSRKEAQNTPLPSNEQLNKLADNAIKEINNIAMRDPITANKIRNEILGAIEEELNNRKNTDTSLPF